MDIVQQTASKNQYSLILDDIIHWAESYQGEPFHAILTDPPYHLTSIVKRFSKGEPGHTKTARDIANRSTPHARQAAGFMNQSWDGTDESGQGIAFKPETWAALAEHLYPGGFIMAFAGTRGYHRMACAMEDAGLIIHPALGFLFGTGFPKATRIKYTDNTEWLAAFVDIPGGIFNGHRYGLQALKPAFEFIAVAQRPYAERPIDCITTTGAGAWNIDGGRVGLREENESGWSESGSKASDNRAMGGPNYEREPKDEMGLGRWPANLLLDESGAELLDRQSGILTSGTRNARTNEPSQSVARGDFSEWESARHEGDSGGASRFFFQSHWAYEVFEQIEASDPVYYTSKPSSAEREAGLDSLPTQTRNRVNSGGLENEPRFAPTQVKNNHPTVKSISLNKYLATLLLPPDAYAPRRILVPFMGSGSEVCGAILAGWEEVVGIEANPDYHRIAEARLAWWSKWPGWGQTEVDKILAAAKPKEEELQAVQMEMF